VPFLATTTSASDLAWNLWRVSLLRGIAALAVGAYGLARPISSPVALGQVVAIYWIFEGLLALWTSQFVAARATTRALLLVRAIGGIGAAVILLVLPLGQIRGDWRPGQFMLFIITAASVLTVIGVQIILAAAIDLVIGLEVRRRIPGEWSLALGALVSTVLGVVVAVGVLGLITVPDHLVGIIGVAGGLSLLIGASRLRRARSSPSRGSGARVGTPG